MVRRALARAGSALSLTLAAHLLWRWGTAAPLAAARTGSASFDELVGLAAALTCWALLGWVVLVLALTMLASIPGALGRLADDAAARLTPTSARRFARLAVGIAVVAGPVAMAAPVTAVPAATRVVATADGPGQAIAARSFPGIERPGWSESTSRVADVSAPGSAAAPLQTAVTVVVVPGDCLWTIAARTVGPAASDAQIAAEWPRWYAANRSVIGADPDLLHPGIVLRAPTAQ